jgi:hypothetical protein
MAASQGRLYGKRETSKQKGLMKKILVSVVALVSAVSISQAAHVWEDPGPWWSSHWTYEVTPESFSANELTLDLFGAYITGPNHGEDSNSERWGGGVGLNYFFLKGLGVGVEAEGFDNHGKLVDTFSSSLIGRIAIKDSPLAPYGFIGAGRTTAPTWEWLYYAGGGLEVRLNPATGLFVDGRWNVVERYPNYGLIRAGLRLAF